MTDPEPTVWHELRRTRDPRLRDRLVLAHTRLVRQRARRLAARLPPWLELEDLESAGLEGLLQAVDRFDPDRGVRFEAFAQPHVDGRMLDELRALDWAPRSVRRRPAGRRRLVPLDAPSDDRAVDVADLVPDEAAEAPEQAACRAGLQQAVDASLARLPLRDALVLQLHYHEELTLAEVGELLGIGQSRAHTIHVRALAELHGALADVLGGDVRDASSLTDAA